jgi:hypothetical protein
VALRNIVHIGGRAITSENPHISVLRGGAVGRFPHLAAVAVAVAAASAADATEIAVVLLEDDLN